jgi:hypothetical protein
MVPVALAGVVVGDEAGDAATADTLTTNDMHARNGDRICLMMPVWFEGALGVSRPPVYAS